MFLLYALRMVHKLALYGVHYQNLINPDGMEQFLLSPPRRSFLAGNDLRLISCWDVSIVESRVQIRPEI